MKIESHIYKQLGGHKKPGLVETMTYRRIFAQVEDAVTEAHWVAFHGEIGSGKTESVENCLDQLYKKYNKSVRFVNLYWPERSGINIAEVHNQIIFTLGEEMINNASPRRGKEVRAMQVLEILATAKSRGLHVVLIIDEAHELHYMTMKALKRLREYKFRGKRDLISIILIGQPKLEHKINSDREVKLRCYPYEVAYTQAERKQIALHHGGGIIEDEEAEELAARFHNLGDMLAAIRKGFIKAIALGDGFDLSCIEWPKAPPKQERKAVKVDESSVSEIEAKLLAKSGNQSSSSSIRKIS